MTDCNHLCCLNSSFSSASLLSLSNYFHLCGRGCKGVLVVLYLMISVSFLAKCPPSLRHSFLEPVKWVYFARLPLRLKWGDVEEEASQDQQLLCLTTLKGVPIKHKSILCFRWKSGFRIAEPRRGRWSRRKSLSLRTVEVPCKVTLAPSALGSCRTRFSLLRLLSVDFSQLRYNKL